MESESYIHEKALEMSERQNVTTSIEGLLPYKNPRPILPSGELSATQCDSNQPDSRG
jgi:hypothetical protein